MAPEAFVEVLSNACKDLGCDATMAADSFARREIAGAVLGTLESAHAAAPDAWLMASARFRASNACTSGSAGTKAPMWRTWSRRAAA